ncbi:MAG: hypothetical protein A2Z42_02655 [Candidatus Woykebacteria bacterium RBG_19FT_COMBO_43_10]|uniref:AttH domain-containing protein n=1 Tax=Candidatus Woykebacteria bacterium RBG_19FT_COMBO_43_10 TaxID=1802598 RepID=A0A1G1WJ76_9BACT|nr:MAG: hypothetical protein A2Z42_02655 [Candidatus Woykebacteria bacterium RBG_19FT_COMBO_43_10]
MPNFLIKKWYLDAADSHGNVFIGYWALLQWKKLTLHGYQLFHYSLKDGIKTQGGFIKQPEPLFRDNHLVWQPKNLKASWESSSNSIREVLFNSEKGDIKWQCLQPTAKAKIQLPEFSFEGQGYTELIEITLPIWNLPFKTLCWGRAHSKNHYLVWIKWDGVTKQNLVWHDGKRSNDLHIKDNLINGSNFRLKLGENNPLRQGRLTSTVFKPFNKIIRLFPKPTFLADEHKWLNYGFLETDSISEPATIIYEKVLW